MRRKRKLRSRVKASVRSTNAKNATVIDVAINRATVRLANGAILTMLPTAGSVSVGDKVIVDYSGPAPLVKASI
jgi:hypothetical protein